MGAFCTILKRQPIAVSKYLVQNALALSHLRNIPVKVSKYALWRRTDGTDWKHASRWPQLQKIQSIQQDLHNALGLRSLISAQCQCWYWHMPEFQCAFPHCFATKVTATTIVASFIPSSPLHFLTVSAIPPCLCGTFPRFGDLLGHRVFTPIITHAPVHINDFRGVRARYVKRTG